MQFKQASAHTALTHTIVQCSFCSVSCYGSLVRKAFIRRDIPCILIIITVCSPTDAQLDNIKNNFKFALKLFLILTNCASVGEQTVIIIKMHGMYIISDSCCVQGYDKRGALYNRIIVYIYISVSKLFSTLSDT
jgi:hypothetical protein